MAKKHLGGHTWMVHIDRSREYRDTASENDALREIHASFTLCRKARDAPGIIEIERAD
ncbi:hypothetical protein [Burkholderia cenocepacia]|uniref:hypothetical protein n=1 Tax=Burkholderia cenocepacia TaxID=95486 RepID=UPI002ABD4CC2|nr:hypothetical protein [Burkholderia cenocepacia]